ncbi:hypothetical protein [uncultured Roseobacter sp.]|uniref:hypothetical protein n=1 Tax=uncultured Roseobacter sp. TaxID=114847 RepID=UPI00262D02F4|nr:hypothetical protein [uncultured Roseobacter sp.]
MTGRRLLGGALAAALIGATALGLPNALGNLFLTATSAAFYIPAQSSLWRFRATVMNEGSGDWWLYGEDAAHYYAVSDDDHFAYVYLPKHQAPVAMDPRDTATWGPAAQRVEVAR